MTPIHIDAKFADRILVPGDALPKGCPSGVCLKTSDDVVCLAYFLSTWDNGQRRYYDELDRLCHRQWNCSFDLIETMWQGRLGQVGDIWHYMELKRV